MSWRWIVDTRGGQVKVDKKWLLIGILAGIGIWVGLRALLPFWVAIAAAFVIAPLLIVIDVRLRKDRPNAQQQRDGDASRLP